MGIRQAWLPEMEGKSVPSRLLDLAKELSLGNKAQSFEVAAAFEN